MQDFKIYTKTDYPVGFFLCEIFVFLRHQLRNFGKHLTWAWQTCNDTLRKKNHPITQIM